MCLNCSSIEDKEGDLQFEFKNNKTIITVASW